MIFLLRGRNKKNSLAFPPQSEINFHLVVKKSSNNKIYMNIHKLKKIMIHQISISIILHYIFMLSP